MNQPLNIFLQHTCVYTRSGLRLLLDELNHHDLTINLIEAGGLNISTSQELQHLNVDVFILELQVNSRNFSDMLRFMLEWLPRYAPQAKVIVMAPKNSIGRLTEYLLGLNNVCAVLDNGSPLEVLRLKLKVALQFRKQPPVCAFPAANLSSLELNILDYLLKGISVPDIAKQQGIHYKTVFSHKQSALRKLGVRSLNVLLTAGNRRKAATKALNRLFENCPKYNSDMTIMDEK
ncbi:hypothetical protein C9426_32095 [Serratia sp. S1B]|nr:hypothetical protein C9426_32095 [Serratia sp. S1B]